MSLKRSLSDQDINLHPTKSFSSVPSIMASSDDDEDLKRAVALSLQDPNTECAGGSAHLAINLDSDGETEIGLAGVATQVKANQLRPTSRTEQGLLGLDRKQMESERLARKRKAPSISPPPPRRKAASDSSVTCVAAKDTNLAISQTPTAAQPPSASNSKGSVFPAGTVKKTWAFGHERKLDDIKLEEVLQKDDLNLAVLSSFQWEMDWLLAKINTRNTQITLVMQAKDQATRQQYRRETAAMSNLRLCFPSMEGQISCMHSKLMLLSHPHHLRVAVPTANLVPYDWGETGIVCKFCPLMPILYPCPIDPKLTLKSTQMENMVFLIDLPRLPECQRTAVEKMTFFGTELIYFLKAMGLEQSIVDSIYSFDFSATEDLAFVHNIGGAHSKESWRRTGYCGLGRAVKELGLATDKPIRIDFVTSSVGFLNDDYLAMLYLAAQGDNGLTEYKWRNPLVASRKKKTPQGDVQPDNILREHLRSQIRQSFQVYYPTHDTVTHSTAGSAGTICFQSKWYHSPTFPQEILRDCKSVRHGMLMHNKVRIQCLCLQFNDVLTPTAIVRTAGGRSDKGLGVRWVSQLFGERMG